MNVSLPVPFSRRKTILFWFFSSIKGGDWMEEESV